jgi:hypothetical protein
MTVKTPLQVVELRQPRCALRFGVGTCPATGTPKCYNTWATCQSSATRAVYDNTGFISWRFVRNSPGKRMFGDFTDADDTQTNGIPVSGLTVSASKSQINVGGILSGKSPFGILGSVTVTMDDFQWADPVGDFYLADRTDMPARTFWAVFMARNALLSNMELRIYDGYEGDDLADMRQRLYILDSIDGPSGGRVTLKGIDPLMLADGRRSLFPPAYDMSLYADITATATSLDVITGDEANISGAVGMSTNRYILIGSEIIGYTGYTVVTAGQYTLTGLLRGQGGSTVASASSGAKIGRVGYFENRLLVDVAKYLLTDWTTIADALIDDAGWDAERDDYLSVSYTNAFIAKPTPVVDLMGELCQQGTFNVWWDEYAQLIKLQAVRPPSGTVTALTDTNAILADSAELTMDPDARLTRILVLYDAIDATKTGAENYRVVTGLIEADGEVAAAGGEPRTVQILARWITTEAQAYQVISRTFLRYKSIPQMLSIRISAKDREIDLGEALDITTRAVVDTEGKTKQKRWQVVSVSEIVMGQTYQLDMQDFGFDGRFAWIAANASPNYPSATTAEKDPSGFFSDSAGLMADGASGYLFQ